MSGQCPNHVSAAQGKGGLGAICSPSSNTFSPTSVKDYGNREEQSRSERLSLSEKSSQATLYTSQKMNATHSLSPDHSRSNETRQARLRKNL